MTQKRFIFEDLQDAAIVNRFPLVEFDRKPLDRHPLWALVITWNSELTLVPLMDREQFRLNGYAVFRNADVSRWRCISNYEFRTRAARILRLRPCAPAEVTISSVKEAARSAGEAFPL